MHRAYSTVYSGGLAHRSCMSFSWCIHPKHMEEKWKPFWLKLKFILNQSSKLLGNCRCTHAHKFTSAFPHTRKDTRISPMYARVFVLSAPSPCGLAACMDRREEASVLLNVVFSPHYCQGIHRWLMMDYISAAAQGFPSACDLQQRRALFALAATLTMESTAQGISHKTF